MEDDVDEVTQHNFTTLVLSTHFIPLNSMFLSKEDIIDPVIGLSGDG